ncbi:MAG: hypothetical protein EBS53_14170, partial [Bacteroidetes bacterium]|nr:hypothetical protein [Bacteroidota bacterium]
MQPILSLCTATAAFFRFRLGLCLLAGAAAATSWPVAPAQARATANTSAQSQNIPSIRGEVRDARNGQPLTGASVVLKGTSLGATTDLNGKFTLQGNLESGRSYPLVVSYIGYNTENTNGVAGGKALVVRLTESTLDLQGVDIVDSRISEKQKESALTVEAMDILAVKETPSPSF